MKDENEEIEIILIEDNFNDAMLMKISFKQANLGNTIIHLKDGAEALDYFFNDKKFDGHKFTDTSKLILLDLRMPKVNGIEVLQQLKSSEKTKSIPVVILTGHFEDPDIRTCYALGANSYIVKPVNFDNFAKTVKDIGAYWVLLNRQLKNLANTPSLPTGKVYSMK